MSPEESIRNISTWNTGLNDITCAKVPATREGKSPPSPPSLLPGRAQIKAVFVDGKPFAEVIKESVALKAQSRVACQAATDD
jgi:hypothetical protein